MPSRRKKHEKSVVEYARNARRIAKNKLGVNINYGIEEIEEISDRRQKSAVFNCIFNNTNSFVNLLTIDPFRTQLPRTYEIYWESLVIRSYVEKSPDWLGIDIRLIPYDSWDVWALSSDEALDIWSCNPGIPIEKGIIKLENRFWKTLYNEQCLDLLHYYVYREFWLFLKKTIESQKQRFEEIYPGEKITWVVIFGDRETSFNKSIINIYSLEDNYINTFTYLPMPSKYKRLIPIPSSLATFP